MGPGAWAATRASMPAASAGASAPRLRARRTLPKISARALFMPIVFSYERASSMRTFGLRSPSVARSRGSSREARPAICPTSIDYVLCVVALVTDLDLEEVDGVITARLAVRIADDRKLVIGGTERIVTRPVVLVIGRFGIHIVLLVAQILLIDRGAIALLERPPAFRGPRLLTAVPIAERNKDLVGALVADSK